MSILELNDDVHEYTEFTPVKSGEEYELRVISFIQGTNKNNQKYFMPFFEVVGEPYSKEFGDYMVLPGQDGLSERDNNKAKQRISDFIKAFNLGTSIDFDADVGATGWAILGMGKDQDDQPTNKINKYIVGH